MTRESAPALAVANPSSCNHTVRQSRELQSLPTAGLPVGVQVAFSGVAWFLAVMSLNLAGGPRLDLAAAIVTGVFVMFLTLLLLAASMVIYGPRWRLHHVDALLGIALLRVNSATVGWLGRPTLGPPAHL